MLKMSGCGAPKVGHMGAQKDPYGIQRRLQWGPQGALRGLSRSPSKVLIEPPKGTGGVPKGPLGGPANSPKRAILNAAIHRYSVCMSHANAEAAAHAVRFHIDASRSAKEAVELHNALGRCLASADVSVASQKPESQSKSASIIAALGKGGKGGGRGSGPSSGGRGRGFGGGNPASGANVRACRVCGISNPNHWMIGRHRDIRASGK